MTGMPAVDTRCAVVAAHVFETVDSQPGKMPVMAPVVAVVVAVRSEVVKMRMVMIDTRRVTVRVRCVVICRRLIVVTVCAVMMAETAVSEMQGKYIGLGGGRNQHQGDRHGQGRMDCLAVIHGPSPG